MTTIYLVRHSESIGLNNLIIEDANNDQLINEKLPLSPEGESKAETFSKNDEFKNIDAVFCSEYERAISTAKYFAINNNIKLIITKNLNERKIGDAKDYPKTFWITQFEDEIAKAPNGENRKEVTERITSFVNRILKQYKNKRIILVTHGTAITYLLMNWCELVNVELENKVRHLAFKGEDIINENINFLYTFKLTFEDNDIANVEFMKLVND